MSHDLQLSKEHLPIIPWKANSNGKIGTNEKIYFSQNWFNNSCFHINFA